MKSLSRIMKEPKEEHKIRPYDFFSGFTKTPIEPPKEEQEELKEAEEETKTEEELEEEQQASAAASEIIEQAKRQAEQILSDAREHAEILREKGYEEGRAQGEAAGYAAAHEEQRQILNEEVQRLRRNITDVLESVTHEKEKIIEHSVDSLKDISITVAEKIIKTSIAASGDIVKRMILAATDKMKKRQWAKIYVTKCNTVVSLEVDTEFLEALSHLSDNIKIITIDDGEIGTCIVELPDEIVDASVSTQIENIKDIINNAKM